MRPSPRSFVLLLLVVMLAACTRGPEVELLQAELQSRLDANFEDGLFSIEAFQRKGSAPFTDLERGLSGLFVYYDAVLRFEEDYNLTSWDGLNVGTLAYVAGAREAGIEGFRPEGNASGDRLALHGRLDFVEQEGEWVALAPELSRDHEEVALVSRVEGSGPEAVLESVRGMLERNPEVDPTRLRDATIVGVLHTAVSQVDLQFARQEGRRTLGSGPELGTYHTFARAFSAFANEQELPFHAHPSNGSVENGFLVQNGTLDFGLMQSDAAETLHQGWVEEGQPPLPELRALASLWPEAVHIVTLEGTGIRRFEELEGKRIGIGPLGSGTRFTAQRIGHASGFDRTGFEEVREESIDASIQALEAGEVDAIFVIEAVPSGPLQRLARRRPDVRMVRIAPRVLANLAEGQFGYYVITVPARTYPGQANDFQTLGLTAALVTRTEMPGPLVMRVLELLFNGTDELAQAYYRAGFISKDTARLGIAVPLHPAAERFYEEQ